MFCVLSPWFFFYPTSCVLSPYCFLTSWRLAETASRRQLHDGGCPPHQSITSGRHTCYHLRGRTHPPALTSAILAGRYGRVSTTLFLIDSRSATYLLYWFVINVHHSGPLFACLFVSTWSWTLHFQCYPFIVTACCLGFFSEYDRCVNRQLCCLIDPLFVCFCVLIQSTCNPSPACVFKL